MEKVLPPMTLAGGAPIVSTRSGATAPTVNPATSEPLPPPGFVTVTARTPGVALAATVMFTVSWAVETKVTLFTVTPAPKLAVAPVVANIDPLTVTDSVAPGPADGGDSVATVGGTRI